MKTILTMILLFSFSTPSANDIAMQGLRIGDSQKTLKNVSLAVDSKEGKTIKYKTENGNDLSVTCRKGKIVYIENDWLQNENGKQPLYSDFVFGETSLQAIRDEFGTNGFTHARYQLFTTETHLIAFNCFEMDSPGKEVFVTITKVSLNSNATVDDVADKLKLDAIILADPSYLDQIWGTEKVYDTNYHKIKPW